MIPAALLTWVTGKVGASFAKPVIYGVLIVLLIVGFGVAKCTYDKHIIAAANDKQTASTATADKKADDSAADQRVTDTKRQTDESAQTQGAINAAKRNGADARAAYYDCVRKQQSARSAGKPSPKC